ncbi:MAG: LLM class flavin-dependent oxidoreductase, partial [Gammaproteobacteria bacterium]
MKLGVVSFNTEYTIRADELAVAAEERGFDSVWFPEHTHIPASRRTPFPAGGDLPREYIHMSDPVISCMAAAAATRDL